MHSINKKRTLTGLVAGLALAFGASMAHAQSQEGTNGGLGIHYGVGDHYQRVTLQYETPSIWTVNFGGNWGRLDLTPEFGVSYWWAQGDRSPDHVWQANAIPMFRWWTSDRFFLEAGVGATVFSHTTFADKTISTAFQFGDHIGAGFLLNDNSRIGVRYSHFSNASIKRPNPGLNVLQLTYLYQF
ncbi:lipoprotein [Bordetella ansorpii]|uniref:Lipid A deacylase n=1 Tax=Bordetella ansorpii TaxID=288768 RepID=A0A157PQS2_9BORD|nr:acyloxyacyl hydrolase [Bordetella ansorpii]SAI35716.1 lipoprotein [Bordetella ansorpii]